MTDSSRRVQGRKDVSYPYSVQYNAALVSDSQSKSKVCHTALVGLKAKSVTIASPPRDTSNA